MKNVRCAAMQGAKFSGPDIVKENASPGQTKTAGRVRQKFQELITRPWRSKRKGNAPACDNQNSRQHSRQFLGPHRVDSVYEYYELDYTWRMNKMRQDMEEMSQLGSEGYAKKRTFEVYAGIRSHHIIQEIKQLRREFQACQSKGYRFGETTYSDIHQTFPGALGTAGQPQSSGYSREFESYSPNHHNNGSVVATKGYSQAAEDTPDLGKISEPNVTGNTSISVLENRSKPEATYMGLKLIREPLNIDDRSAVAAQESRRPSPALIRKSSNIHDWPLRQHTSMENSHQYSTHEGCYQQASSGMSFTQLLSEPRCASSNGNSNPMHLDGQSPDGPLPPLPKTEPGIHQSPKHGSMAQSSLAMEHEEEASISGSIDESAHCEDHVSQCELALVDFHPGRNEIAAAVTADGQSVENEKQMESPWMENHSVDSECNVNSEVKVLEAATAESRAIVVPSPVPAFVSHSESDAANLIDSNEENERFALHHVDEHSGVKVRQTEVAADHTEHRSTNCAHQETPDQSSSIQTDQCYPKNSIQIEEDAKELSKQPVDDPALSSFLQRESCLNLPTADSQQVEIADLSQCSKPTANSCEDERFHQLQDFEGGSISCTAQSTVDKSHWSTPKTKTQVYDPEQVSPGPVALVFDSGAIESEATSENAGCLEDPCQDPESSLAAAKEVDHLQSPEKASQSRTSSQPLAVAVKKECKQWISGKDGIHESLQHTSHSGLCHDVSEAEEMVTCSNSNEEFENTQDRVHQAESQEEQNKGEVSTFGLQYETDDPQGSTAVHNSASLDVNKDPIVCLGADPVEDEGWGLEVETETCSEELESGSCAQITGENFHLPKCTERSIVSQALQEDAEDLNPGADILMNDESAENLAVSKTERHDLDCNLDREGGIEVDILRDLIDDVQLAECNEQSPRGVIYSNTANSTSTTSNGCFQPLMDQEIVDQHALGDTFPIPSLHEHSGSEDNTIFKEKSLLASTEEGYRSSENVEIDHKDLCDTFDWSNLDPITRGDHPVSIVDNSETGISNQLSGLHYNSGDEQQDSLIKVPEFLTSFSGAALADDDFTLKLPHQLKGWAGDEEASRSSTTGPQELTQHDSILDEV